MTVDPLESNPTFYKDNTFEYSIRNTLSFEIVQ